MAFSLTVVGAWSENGPTETREEPTKRLQATSNPRGATSSATNRRRSGTGSSLGESVMEQPYPAS